ncbi:MAG: hypothetical protein JWN32_3099 [Solirubrobacterales bacterium]|nr:hypothetical protein [Solirubrobacterales bacterium]
MRVLAVDWSGKRKRAEEFLWLAEARDGELVSLQNGRSRHELVRHVLALVEADPETVVGFDFAFSFPKWWCDAQRWHRVEDVWAAMATDGESLLDACESPFWGRPGKPNPHPIDRSYRRTERDGNQTAKSVFQIGGAGAVGTGSIRGMPHLRTLAQHEFSVWPFTSTGWPRVVEIYPRALTGPVNKSNWGKRHAFLHERFPAQPATLLERAAGSEDAFDAAVSALVMGQHQDQLATLSATADPYFAIEGKVWRPG